MKEVTGNLIDMAFAGDFDVIVHGANCFCVMGAGIAKEIRQRCPEAYLRDSKTKKGAKSKLGTINYASERYDNPKPRQYEFFIVVNAYTQYLYGGTAMTGPHLDYDAVRSCFKAIREQFSGKRIGYPMIGAGLAGGDWSRISAIIDDELDGEDHTFVRFK